MLRKVPALVFALFFCILFFAFLSAQARADREGSWRDRRNASNRRGNEQSERPRGPVRFRHIEHQRNPMENNGDGCPDGSISAIFSPDNLSFSLVFDQFIAEAKAANIDANRNARRDILRCNIILNLDVPEGMRMTITRMDYRGFVSIPAGARAKLRSSVSFLKQNRRQGPRREFDKLSFNKEFQGPIQDDYLITSDVIEDAGRDAFASSCGGTSALRLDNRLVVVNAPRASEDASITVDSIDGSGNVVYYVSWAKCAPN